MNAAFLEPPFRSAVVVCSHSGRRTTGRRHRLTPIWQNIGKIRQSTNEGID